MYPVPLTVSQSFGMLENLLIDLSFAETGSEV